ncbi:MAG: D-glycerate dehydrogenase [Dehalococcoidia bacterium]|nr:D-glycerate dehydrogenase [Dehalococcoidia bacterium]
MNVKPRIVVTQRIAEEALDLLREAGAVGFCLEPDQPPSAADLLSAVRDADAMLCMLTDNIDKGVLEAGSRLLVVANMAVGYNNIDIGAATARRIPVTNTPGILTETTADLAWALLLAVARRVVEGDRLVKAGQFKGWQPMLLLGGDVHGKTLGVVGMGRIGTAVARRARGFGMTVVYHARHRIALEVEAEAPARRVSLEALLRSSDFVSIHAPYSSETHHLIGAKELAMMKPSAYLVNTSRGPLVDETALVEALKEGRLAGAALDVFEHEPELAPGLAGLLNVVLTPHIGSASRETRTRMAIMAAGNIVAALQGKRPPNLVNPEVYP